MLAYWQIDMGDFLTSTLSSTNSKKKRKFAFKMGATIVLYLNSTKGEIIGRAQYESAQDDYLVKYLNGNGDFCKTWVTESDISKA